MVWYNGLVLPLQWKSTHRSQASKRVCLCFGKVLFMDTTTWTRPLHPLLMWLMARLMLSSSTQLFILFVFYFVLRWGLSLSWLVQLECWPVNPRGIFRFLPPQHQNYRPIHVLPHLALSMGSGGANSAYPACVTSILLTKWPHLPQSLPYSLCVLKDVLYLNNPNHLKM